MDGIGQAVLRDFRITVCQSGNNLTRVILVVGVKTYEGVCCEARTVNRGVQSGIQMIRLGCQIDLHNVSILAVLLCIHEVLGSEYGSEITGPLGLLHVQIVVIVQGKHCAGSHQHILCLMHLRLTICKIGVLTDLIDQAVIGIPLRCIGIDIAVFKLHEGRIVHILCIRRSVSGIRRSICGSICSGIRCCGSCRSSSCTAAAAEKACSGYACKYEG